MFFSVYNKFKYKNWIRMNNGRRQKVLEKIEKKQSKKLKRPSLPIVINTNPDWHCFGMFENKNGKKLLYLSINLLQRPELRFHALETVIHEGRHAYQHHLINKKKLGLFNFKGKRWKRNYMGYISSKEDSAIYSMQPIERDAQKYAIKEMSKLKGKFKNERDYHITIENMVSRYENSERELKDRHGIFYKFAINKKIKNKSTKRH